MSGYLFSFIDSLGETVDTAFGQIEAGVDQFSSDLDQAVQVIDAGVDLDEVLDQILQAGSDEALLRAYQRLEHLARSQPVAVLQGWVVDGKVVPVVCKALCKLESARLAAGSLARILNGLERALDASGATNEELAAFAEQLVRHTENGRAMLKLMEIEDCDSQTEGLTILRRVYPHMSGVLRPHLRDPGSITSLMQILQGAGGSFWAADAAEAGPRGPAALCAECVRFLRLVTREDGEIRMVVTFQDGVEALLAIVAQALGSPQHPAAASFLETAADACSCVWQLAGHGSVAQKYIREAGHLGSVIRTLRCVVASAAGFPAGHREQLEGVALKLLGIVGSFVGAVGGIDGQEAPSGATASAASTEAAASAQVLLNRCGLVDAVCAEALAAPELGLRTKLAMLSVLRSTFAAADASVLGCLLVTPSGFRALDAVAELLLGGGGDGGGLGAAELRLRDGLDGLLAEVLGRSGDARSRLAESLEAELASAAPPGPTAEAAQPRGSPAAPRAAALALAALRRAGAGGAAPAPAAGAWPPDPGVWFAAHLVGHCVRGSPELRRRLSRPPHAGCESVLSIALGPVAALARTWRQRRGSGAAADGEDQAQQQRSLASIEASLAAALRLAAEWCEGCREGAQAVANSPSHLPELLALLEAPASQDGSCAHVRGLAALALGVCLLELSEAPPPAPQGQSGGGAASQVDAARLLQLIAQRVGVDAFTRAAAALRRAFPGHTAGGGPPPGGAAYAGVQRYQPEFVAFATLRFQQVEQAMVRIWLAQEAGPQGAPGGGVAAAAAVTQSGKYALAEDVAEHFKDLIKMQDKELHSLRAEVKKLREENEQLHKLATDEDKRLLLWKVDALKQQCEELQVQCDRQQVGRSHLEVARLRERQAHRAQRLEMQRQLQALAEALESSEAEATTARRRQAGAPTAAAAAEDEEGGPSPSGLEEVTRERDDLLAALELIGRKCPNARPFLAPLSQFALPSDELVQAAEAVEVPAVPGVEHFHIGEEVDADAGEDAGEAPSGGDEQDWLAQDSSGDVQRVDPSAEPMAASVAPSSQPSGTEAGRAPGLAQGDEGKPAPAVEGTEAVLKLADGSFRNGDEALHRAATAPMAAAVSEQREERPGSLVAAPAPGMSQPQVQPGIGLLQQREEHITQRQQQQHQQQQQQLQQQPVHGHNEELQQQLKQETLELLGMPPPGQQEAMEPQLQSAEQQRLEEQLPDERQRLENQLLEQQQLEQKRLEQQRLEEQRLEEQRLEEQRLQEQRLEQQRRDQQQLEQHRLEQHRLEQQRLEQQRLELEQRRRAQQHLEQRQQEQLLAQQRLEQQRLEQQQLEQQRQQQLLEQQRLEQQRLEQQRLEQHQLEQQRLQQQQDAQPAAQVGQTEVQQQQQQQQQQQHEQQQQQAAQAQVTPLGSEGLPAGWTAFQTGAGQVFYFNQATSMSQWERPAA